MELIRRFPPELMSAALAHWRWLPDLAGKSPMVATAFGDLFLKGTDGIWFLDTVEGSLTHGWDGPEALQAELQTPEGQHRYLMAGLVGAAHEAGLAPGEREVLSFTVPPVLGGAFEPENLEVSDLEVSLAVAGQVHRQVKDLPPGTPVTGVDVSG